MPCLPGAMLRCLLVCCLFEGGTRFSSNIIHLDWIQQIVLSTTSKYLLLRDLRLGVSNTAKKTWNRESQTPGEHLKAHQKPPHQSTKTYQNTTRKTSPLASPPQKSPLEPPEPLEVSLVVSGVLTNTPTCRGEKRPKGFGPFRRRQKESGCALKQSKVGMLLFKNHQEFKLVLHKIDV